MTDPAIINPEGTSIANLLSDNPKIEKIIPITISINATTNHRVT